MADKNKPELTTFTYKIGFMRNATRNPWIIIPGPDVPYVFDKVIFIRPLRGTEQDMVEARLSDLRCPSKREIDKYSKYEIYFSENIIEDEP